MIARVQPPLFPLLVCVAIIHLAGSTRADVGPENVAVVVNEDSWASMTVANEFVHLRGIPPANVIYLKDLPDFEQTDVATFREKILTPVIGTLVARGIAAQVSCIAYSSDLPFRINVSADMKGRKFPKIITPWAAINGLTYLNSYVLRKDPSYLNLRINRYGRRPEPELNAEPVRESDREDYAAAINLLMDKKWDEAAIALRAISEDNPHTPDLLYNLACALGRIGEADQAMLTLRRAVDAGFLSHTTMATDKDLESLWQRQDFKDLIEGMKERVFAVQPTRGFGAAYRWSPDGQPGAGAGKTYMLSTMLAVTSGRGNSVGQALAALRRSVAADGTHPAGTVYYMISKDIRSRTRQWGFGAAVGMLEACGVTAEERDPTRRDLRAPHKYGGRARGEGRADPTYGLHQVWGGHRQRYRRRALRDQGEVPRSLRPRPLRSRVHCRGGPLSVRHGALPTAHRRRPALQPVGEPPQGDRRGD